MLGEMPEPMQMECGAPWALVLLGGSVMCACVFHWIPSGTEPSAFGHLFIWVYLEGCSCSSREANALTSSPQVVARCAYEYENLCISLATQRGHDAGACCQANRAGPRLSRHYTEDAQHSETLRVVFNCILMSLFVFNIPVKPPKLSVGDEPQVSTVNPLRLPISKLYNFLFELSQTHGKLWPGKTLEGLAHLTPSRSASSFTETLGESGLPSH